MSVSVRTMLAPAVILAGRFAARRLVIASVAQWEPPQQLAETDETGNFSSSLYLNRSRPNSARSDSRDYQYGVLRGDADHLR
jgi:hypothetical protein